jgi:murein DD-endopeptidase MepM/ murein hydrolase activator NlpD
MTAAAGESMTGGFMKAGFCSVCATNSYLDDTGNCVKGHAEENVSGVYDVPDAQVDGAASDVVPPADTGAPTPAPGRKLITPARLAMIAAGAVIGMLMACPLGIVLGAGSSGSAGPDPTKLAALESQVASLTKERDALKQELDPIRRAEEASAAAAAQAEAAAAKAKADAEAAAAKAKADAEAAAASAAAEAAALEAANTFTDGIYLVGEDIKPGTYRGTVTSDMGYWARLRNTEGGLGSIIANGLPSGPFVLTIKSSDKAIEIKGVKLVRK